MTRVLRVPEVRRAVPVSRVTQLRMAKAGELSAPVRLGETRSWAGGGEAQAVVKNRVRSRADTEAGMRFAERRMTN